MDSLVWEIGTWLPLKFTSLAPSLAASSSPGLSLRYYFYDQFDLGYFPTIPMTHIIPIGIKAFHLGFYQILTLIRAKWFQPRSPLRSYTIEAIGPISSTKDGIYLAGGAISGNLYIWEVYNLLLHYISRLFSPQMSSSWLNFFVGYKW